MSVKSPLADAENALVRHLGRHCSDAVLAALALLVSLHAAFSAATLGDYPDDGGPALTALLHGDLDAFSHARPAMGDVSLLVRAPFAELAHIGHPTQLAIYRWGVLPCVLSVAALALWLARVARERGSGLVGQAAIVLVALVNPIVGSAIELGHPEELMTASLCIGALVAALRAKPTVTALLLGLALACKQWAVVAIVPVLLALDGGAVRVFAGALATAALATVPEFVGAPLSYVHNQLFLASGQGTAPSTWSWWYPLAPAETQRLVIGGARASLSYRRLPHAIASSLHALIIALDVLVAAIVARTRRLPLRRDDAFALMAIVMLLRCTLDTETMAYYHAALLIDLLAWDALAGERLPLRALSAAAVSYVIFDRLVGAPMASSIAYATATLLALGAFALVLVARGRQLAGTRTRGVAATA